MKKILSTLLITLALVVSTTVNAQETITDVSAITTVYQATNFLKTTSVVTQEQLNTIKNSVPSYKILSTEEFNRTIIVPMLGSAKFDDLYQSLFKGYVFNLAKTSNTNAKEIISSELKVFVAVCDENDANQIKWLNRLRLFYAVYSEL